MLLANTRSEIICKFILSLGVFINIPIFSFHVLAYQKLRTTRYQRVFAFLALLSPPNPFNSLLHFDIKTSWPGSSGSRFLISKLHLVPEILGRFRYQNHKTANQWKN